MSVRLDKWLWSVRLYKTRSLAAKECNAGKIKRGNTALKPSSAIQVGDHLDVPSPDGTHKRRLEVVALLEKRVSAPLAREAFVDHTPEDVLQAAAEARARKREARLLRQEGDQGRMTKKKLRDWKSGHRGFFD
jgi:ribosome-associated heat shock protein Hsp15